jgi:excisionase family DNA binding protein
LLLTIEQAAERLNVSRRFLYDYVANGSLPSVTLGRRRLIRRSDLEQFVRDLQPVA